MLPDNSRAFGSPFRYIQGWDEFDHFELHSRELGKRVLFLLDSFLFDSLEPRLRAVYEGSESTAVFERFSGLCTYEEAERVGNLVQSCRADVIVGMGGGNAMDTAKLVAVRTGIRMIMAPTSISTDAPTSAVSMMHTPDGKGAGACPHERHPDLVLVDSHVVSDAPVALTKAGMADALATYIEAMANQRSDNANYIGRGYRRTIAGMAIAKAAYETLLRSGRRALLSAQCGACSRAMEDVIEANTLLSGLGFENCRSAGAHLLAGALTTLPESAGFRHGELVSFGIVFQLMLEDAPKAQVTEVMQFLKDLDLPITLQQIGLGNDSDTVERIVQAALASPDGFGEPFFIAPHDIAAALRLADAAGQAMLRGTAVM